MMPGASPKGRFMAILALYFVFSLLAEELSKDKYEESIFDLDHPPSSCCAVADRE
jgi:hypothetical protein